MNKFLYISNKSLLSLATSEASRKEVCLCLGWRRAKRVAKGLFVKGLFVFGMKCTQLLYISNKSLISLFFVFFLLTFFFSPLSGSRVAHETL